MFKFTKKDERTNLEKEIDSVLEVMEDMRPETEDYQKICENLERLYKAKSYEKARAVSPDVIATIAGNLLGIGIILSYERVHVITTKALGFVIKGRV